MRHRRMKVVLTLVLLLGVFSGGLIAVSAASITRYQTNERGLTYGHVDPNLSPEKQEMPELIAAIGIDGTEGYVYASDLDGEQPKTPEEALKYMEKLEQEIAIARAAKSVYFRTIPLYASDGVTVIGQFGISYPAD